MAHGFTMHGGLGAGGSAILHESSDHSVLVPDTELLFTAQFHRAGPDLVLTGRDGAHHLVPGYFSSEHHPALVAPNGAHLSPDTVDLLAGSPTPGHYAQAQPTAPPDAIGKIEKVVGDVSVVRNGVTVALHVGDAVFKSDVVQTGASSACGISFPDGTALNLVANTRMALNDYAYDANSNSNGALFSLVEGTFAFVAGKVAHSGDMKIATPVATMGIRGTTGVVQEQPNPPATITANAGDHTYSFAVVPDIGTGITGMWDVYLTDAYGIIQRDANGNPIVLVTVSQSGYVTYVTPQGVGQAPLVTTEPVTNSQYAFEQQMLADLFRTLNPSNLNNNNNGGSSTQPPPFNLPNPIPQLFEDTGKPFTINFTNGSTTPTPTIIDIVIGTGPLTVVIWTASSPGNWSTGSNWLGGAQPTSPQEVEILVPIKVTADGNDSAAGLVVVTGATVNIISGATLTILDFINGGGTIQLNSTGTDPTLAIDGAVSLVGGGTIKMIGTPGEDNILGVPGTHAFLINVDYTIEGTGTIGGGDGNLTFENFGTVNANDGLLTVNTGNQVYNDGLMEATVDPVAATAGTLQIKDSVVNAGTVQADGIGAAVTLSGATFDNLFSVVAKNGGSVTFTDVKVTNEAVSATDPAGGTINATGGTITFNGGSIANGNLLEATNLGTLQLENITVTNSSAATATVDGTSTLDLMSASILGGTIENDGNVVVTNGVSVLHGDSVTNSGTMTVEAGASLTLEGDTTLINQAGGHITADGGTVSIEIDADANVNSGTIEAVNGGEVDFYINVEGGSNHGLIEAGAGGTVHFFQVHQGGGGGGGQGGNYGTMEAADGGALIFDGGLDNFDLLEAVNGGTVNLANGAHNHAGGTILATGGGIVTIDGGLRNEATATVEADDPSSQVDINGFVDNLGTIQATGANAQVDMANGSVDNELGGLIEADTGGTLTFDSTLDGAINAGTIKAGAGGTIIIDGFSGGNGLTNGDGMGDVGTIEAVGTGAKVELAGATIIGGKLGTMGGGIFETVSGTSTLMNVILTGGTFKVDTGTILDLNGGTNGVAAYIDSTVTLKGAGTVEMDFTSYSIRGGLSNGTLNNQTTIEGKGTIGTGDTPLPGVLTLINSGTIEAVGGEFDINTGTRNAATTTNSGTLEANGANAVLLIHHTNMNNADGTGGTIAAINGLDAVSATASVVELLDDVIVGGKLQTSNFGTIETITDHGGASTTIFDGVTNQGYVLVNDNTTLLLRDTIDNTGGKIALALTGQADLQIDGTVTLKNGEVELNTSGDKITALATGAKLENTANIHGQGQIGAGDGKLTFDNLSGSVVNADQTGKTLTVHTGNTVTNAGTLEATNGGTLQIDDAVTNSNVIAAHDSGSAIILAAGGSNSGAITATGGGSITIDNANNSSVFNSNLITAGDGGTITIDNTSNSGIWNSGTLEALTGGTLNIYDLDDNIKNTGTFEADGGTINITHDHTSITNLNLVEAIDGGTINITNINNVSGGGNAGMEKADGGTINVHGGAGNSSGGTTEAIHCGTFDVLDGGLNNASGGTVKAASGGIFDINGGLSNASGGTVEALAGGTVNVSGTANYTNFGTIKADAGHVTLTLTGNGSVSNTGSGATIEALDCGTVDITINHAGNNSGGGVANSGTMEADDGTLNITLNISGCHDSVGIVNSGIIEAIDGGTVNINIDNTGTNNATGMSNSATEQALSGGTLNINSGVGNSGTITADDGTVAITTYLTNSNDGTVVAQDQGTVTISCAQVTTETDSLIGATGAGSTVTIDHSTIDNAGGIGAGNGGAVTIEHSTVDNSGAGTGNTDGIGAETGGTITFEHSDVVNCGDIGADNGGAVKFEHSHVDNSGHIGPGPESGQPPGAVATVTFAYSHVNNSGEIGASTAGVICIDCSTICNTGELDAVNGGVINIDHSTIDNTCGIIEASGCGATINLDQVTITSGTLETSCDGLIQAVCGTSTLDGVTINAGSAVEVTSGATLTLHDATDLGGTLTVDSGATLAIDSSKPGNVSTLDDVTVANNGTIQIDAPLSSATLVLDDDTTISGGIVSIGSVGTLDVETGDNGSGATLDNVTVHDSGAITVGDVCSGATLTLDDGTTITGGGVGTLTVASGSTLAIDSGGATLACLTVDNCGGDITIAADTTLTLDRVNVHGGAIDGTDASGCIVASTIDVTGDSTFCGVHLSGGDLTVESNVTLTLSGDRVSDVAIAGTDASGCIVASTIDVTGDSTFCDVSLSGGNLTVESAHTLTLDNTTLDDVTVTLVYDSKCLVGADLQVDGTLTLDDTTITGQLGIIHNNGGTIDVIGSSEIDNTSLSLGQVNVESNQTLTLDNATLDATTMTLVSAVVHDHAVGANLQVEDTLFLVNATINGTGTIDNCDTIDVQVQGDGSQSEIDGVTIANHGSLQLDAAATLVLNDVAIHGGTIDGTDASGCIVASTIDVTGDSTFCDVNLSGGNLTVEGHVTLNLSGVTVDGTNIDDYTDSGSLVIPGTIEITGNSAINNSTVDGEGGPAQSGTPGAITVDCNVTLTLDNTTLEDLHVTNHGTLQVDGDDTLTLNTVQIDGGTINNFTDSGGIVAGNIDITGDTTFGDLAVEKGNLTIDDCTALKVADDTTVTLDGVSVTDNGALDVGVSSGAILALDGDTGIGGCGAMTINANSTLDVNGGTTTISLVGTIANDGTIEASCGGTLDIVSHVDNSLGALEATSGGKLDIESAICGGTATIHGATLEFDASSNVHVTFDNGSVDSPTYGTLVLGDPEDFHGIISDFIGTCADSAHSDVIDLQGIDYNSHCFNECYNSSTGVLTVTDGLHTAYLNFDDFLGTFKFGSDGDGGTDVYDPPVGGAKDAPATATAAPGNDHVAASASQNGTDHAASPANEAGFLGDQDSTAAATAPDGAAAPPASQLALAGDTVTAPPSATSALGSSDLAAFDNDHVAVPTAGPAPGSVHSGAVTLTIAASPIVVVATGTPVLESEHLTDSTIVDGSGAVHDEVAPPTVPTAPANEHTVAPATITAPPPAASPTLATASLGGLGNDSFAFHPNLGSDAAQTTDAHTSELAHSVVQIGGAAPGSIAPEFHQEFAFDAIHQDAAALAATVDQFHQMAASSTLLH